MADPLSIAGTALSVISIALQVREEITSYCKAWRGAQEEIQDVARKAESLAVPLEALRDIIQDIQLTDPDIAEDLLKKVDILRVGVEKVQASVAKCRPDFQAFAGESFSDKFRAHRKRAAYPFRKDALRALATDLDGMQINLQTTLHIFSAQNVRLIPSMVAMQGQLLREVQDMHLALQRVSNGSSQPPPALLESWCTQQQKQEKVIVSRSNAVTKKYRYHSRLLGLTVAASFSLTRGAGGFSIAPYLSILIPVSRNSPAFRTMFLYPLMAKSLSPADFVDNTIGLLKYLFEEQQASPADTTPDGESLVDAACFAFHQGSQWHRHAYTHFSRLIMFLIHSGAMSDRSCRKHTGLDSFLGAFPLEEDEHGLFKLLIQRGAFLSINGAFFSSLSIPNMRRALEEDEGAVHIPEIAKSIIQQSEVHLRQEIRSGASVNQKIGTSNLLQLSVRWSRGIQILLEAGADINTFSYSSPLEMAIRGNYYESAKVLLQSGCPLNLEHISLSEYLTDQGKMSSLLIAELVSRRKRLFKVAQAHMPPSVLEDLFMKEDDSSVPDVQVSKIITALKERGVNLDPSLKVESPGSVYHYAFQNTRILDQLYEAGFNRVDLYDTTGRTPLMIPSICQSLNGYSQKRVKWLLSKGADPNRKLPWNTGGTVFHLLATCMTNTQWPHMVRAWISGTPNIREKNGNPLLFTRYVLETAERDSCICACVAGPINDSGEVGGRGEKRGESRGCTPFRAAFRNLLYPSTRFYNQEATRFGVNSFAETIGFFISLVGKTTEIEHAVIRLMTFDALDLRHTCCRDSNYEQTLKCPDEDEVHEIRDEEQRLLEDFERLVDELTENFENSSLPLMDFLQGPWYQDVVEYLSHLDPCDEEHVKETQGIGLNLEVAWGVPDRTSLLVGSRVTEISNE
ncbi:hypothetical protein PISL3812_02496 [Talaromyces islandicus]|uniref:Uncharacterized protein n=1 Tax=Talaromyces islandicus TaxID=28573 RepID=A0A0U1LQ31_TALIS|nr:hypothetical protein PISL3812_02496 [Talaromyces islandicus]